MQNLFANECRPLQLEEGKTHAVRLQRPVRVQVVTGLVWMTVEEGGADVWLRPGQTFDFHGGGLAVFEAIKADAEFVLQPLPGFWRRLALGAAGAALRRRRNEAPATSGCVLSTAVCTADIADSSDAAPLVSKLLPKGLIRWF